MNEAFLDTSINHWVAFSLIWPGRIFLLGWAWSWLLPEVVDRRRRLLVYAAYPVLIGLPLLLILRLVSAEVLPLPSFTWLIFALGGIGAGFTTHRKGVLARLLPAVIGWACSFAACAAIMLVPGRSEWIGGGWDPGIYVNEGMQLARTGSYQHSPDPFFSALNEEELKLFTRYRLSYLEAQPVVPLDEETLTIKRFFFPLMSTAIATLAEDGGLRAATRANGFLGFWVVLMFAAMLAAHKLPWRTVGFAIVMLGLQPVWLYHLNIPTSEMLQLLFVCGMGMMLPYLRRHHIAAFVVALLMLCAGLNRFGFLPFGTLLVLVIAICDVQTKDRKWALQSHVLMLVPVWMAAGHCLVHNAITVDRLGDVSQLILLSGGLLTIGVIVVDLLANQVKLVRFIVRSWHQGLVPVYAIVGLVLISLVLHINFANVRLILQGLVQYVSIPLVPAAFGLGFLYVRRETIEDPLRILIFFLLISTALVLLQSEIAPLLPWATRRLMMYTVPLVAVLGALVFGHFTRRHAALGIVALLVLTGLSAPKAWDAVRVSEFAGLSPQLHAVADEIGPNDLVVADHFIFATPLRMITGKMVLNGEVLWGEEAGDAYHQPAADRFAAALPVLKKFRANGWTIRFLTSTDGFLTMYPEALPVVQDWQGESFSYEVLVHGPGATGFTFKPRTKQFTLYTWKPE
ncbi:MAG: hypothetical protein ACI9TH_002702 [Kiritimatiellia bacterium]|jgi:hypothetical protein